MVLDGFQARFENGFDLPSLGEELLFEFGFQSQFEIDEKGGRKKNKGACNQCDDGSG
jgi:hypothetical protein